MSRTRILLTYAFPGSGHEQAARVLLEATHSAASLEMDEYHLRLWKPRLTQAMVFISKLMLTGAPCLWRRLHGNRRYKKIFAFSIRWLLRYGWLGLEEYVRANRYDAIAATHFFMIQLLGEARASGYLSIPVYGVITDFRAHPYWGHEGIDQYFASTEEARSDLIHTGVSRERILVTGIPTSPRFVHPVHASRDGKIVLIAGGTAGLFPYEEMFNEIQQAPTSNICWIFLLGNNRVVYQHLRAKMMGRMTEKIQLLPYRRNLSAYFYDADIAITKAGGLFTSEALVHGVPLIIYHPLPGQEEQNALYLRSSGAARWVRSPTEAAALVYKLLSDVSLYNTMSRAARRLARPHAASQIIHHLSNACS